MAINISVTCNRKGLERRVVESKLLPTNSLAALGAVIGDWGERRVKAKALLG
jgi:hypothetical protein